MPLSRDEQRALAEIERRLLTGDLAFARRVMVFRWRMRRHEVIAPHWSLNLFLAVIALLVITALVTFVARDAEDGSSPSPAPSYYFPVQTDHPLPFEPR
ncbi:hypothetical protein GCM10029978_046680 [Actinoallomurus acanthiterrae]